MVKYVEITKKQVRRRWNISAWGGTILWCLGFSGNLMYNSGVLEGLSYAGLILIGFAFGFAYGLKHKLKGGSE